MTERTERCGTCKWWEVFGTGYEARFGWCHRHAPHRPTNVIQGKCETVGIWPNPEANDFCGQWEPENQGECHASH